MKSHQGTRVRACVHMKDLNFRNLHRLLHHFQTHFTHAGRRSKRAHHLLPGVYNFLYHLSPRGDMCSYAVEMLKNRIQCCLHRRQPLTLLCHILGHPIGGLTRSLLPSSKQRWWNGWDVSQWRLSDAVQKSVGKNGLMTLLSTQKSAPRYLDVLEPFVTSHAWRNMNTFAHPRHLIQPYSETQAHQNNKCASTNQRKMA